MAGSKGIKAGRAFVEIFADNSSLNKGLRVAQARLQAFGGMVKKIGGAALGTGGAILAPMIGALGALNSLVGEANGNIGSMMMLARNVGVQLSSGAAVAALEFAVALRQVFALIKGVAVAIGVALAPELTSLLRSVASVLDSWIQFIQQNRLLIVGIAKVGVALIGIGAGLLALGFAISAAGTAAGIMVTVLTSIGAVLAFLMTPIGAVIGGLVALTAYILTSTEIGRSALAYLADGFQILKEDALAAFGGIADALASGNLSLAMKILWLTLKMEWQRGILFLQTKWADFKTFFQQLASDAFFGVLELANNAWAGMQTAWIETTSFMARAWTNFTSGFMSSWRTAQNFVSKGVLKLMALFDSSIDADAAAEILDQDLARANAEAAAASERALQEGERKRQERLGAVEQQRQQSESALISANNATNESIAANNRKGLADTADALTKARAEWQEAIGQAAKERKAGSARQQSRLARLDTGLQNGKASSLGTFSAFEVGGRSTTVKSLLERVADATEKTAKNTQPLVNPALLFGP